MIYRVYSIRDVLSGFMTPVIETSDPVAMRNFEMAVDKMKRDSSVLAFRPSDFSMYHIADFDSESGIMYPISPIELICSGLSFKE